MSDSASSPPSRPFGDIRLFTLRNRNGIEIDITNYGAILVAIRTPDRNGHFADITLGHSTLEGYLNTPQASYLGAVVGRFGNRIAGGRFAMDGVVHELACNDNNAAHLHGGLRGIDKLVWTPEPVSSSELRLHVVSPDGDQGYPGTVRMTVTYALTDVGELVVDYTAETDQPTPFNPTQHAYFNLSGEGSGDVLSHRLRLYAGAYLPVDAASIPTGEIRPVAGTPFDFTVEKEIGRDIAAPDDQIRQAGGYNHCLVLDASADASGLRPCAEVFEPVSGRTLEVSTSEPGVQFYTGNHLTGISHGKSGGAYGCHTGFCLETQHYPDSPNQPAFPDCILRPGKPFVSRTVFRFGVKHPDHSH